MTVEELAKESTQFVNQLGIAELDPDGFYQGLIYQAYFQGTKNGIALVSEAMNQGKDLVEEFDDLL